MTEEEFAALDLKEINLSGRSFYVSRLAMISHFPMNRELKIEKTLREISQKGYQTVAPLFIIFADGLFSGKIMVEIVKPSIKDPSVITLKDLKLVGKNFTGAKHLVPKALKEFDRYLMSKKILTTEFYFRYLSCKICEEGKGNRTIIMGRVK
jgi:hypothetical protein